MTILKTVLASAPTDVTLIPTIEVNVPGHAPIRIARGYENHMLGVDGVMQEFEAGPIDVSLPKKNTSGNQTLNFAIADINGQSQKYVDAALESGKEIKMTYRSYLSTDKSSPAERPLELTVVGGRLVKTDATFEASYHDLLNTAWPRERYTAEVAPGVKYL